MTLVASPLSEFADAPDIALGVGGILVLDETAPFVSVEAGRVEIYGMVGETRCFLAEFEEGAVLPAAGDARFVALAPDGARLSPYAPRGAAHEAEIIEVWLRPLLEGLARYAPARPDLKSVMVGESVALSEG